MTENENHGFKMLANIEERIGSAVGSVFVVNNISRTPRHSSRIFSDLNFPLAI